MSIAFSGFTGPTYALENRYAAIERCINWYPVPNESPDETKSRIFLAPSPQNVAFSELPVPAPFNAPNRGLIENRGSVYGVNGTVVFRLNADGTMTNMGNVSSDGNPVSMVANGNGQIFIASSGNGYCISNGALSPVGAGFLGASYATFQDGYIIVVTPGTNQFQISGDDGTPLGDALIWSAANVSIQAGQADNLQAVISSREYLRLLGKRRSQVYQNVGNNGIGNFPFQSYNETFIETGCAAPFSLADLGDSLVWIGEDARGQRACWRDAAFQPRRISTFAVEQKWQSYSRVDDAVSFPFIWNGHLMYQVTFPSALIDPNEFPVGSHIHQKTGATWVYDATASQLLGRPLWHERAYQTALGSPNQRSEMFHCFAFGKHLVGSGGVDGNPGAIYQYANVGTTNQNPQLLLRWSNDAGNAYRTELNMPLGLIGEYETLVRLNRLGYSRDRVYWLRYADETECGTDGAGSQSQQPVVRDRICPHIWSGQNRVIHNRIWFALTVGIGSVDGVTANPFSLGIVGAMLDLIPCSS